MTNRARNLAVLLACASIALFCGRFRLLNDTLWEDEIHVLIGSHSRSPIAALPLEFHHDSLPVPSLSGTLQQLAKEDAYPPLVYVALLTLGKLGHPILLPRLCFTLLNAVLMFALYQVAAPRVGKAPAFLIALISTFSAPLIVVGSELKWTAIAPAVVTFVGLALLHALRTNLVRSWLIYGALLWLSLNIHYFLCFYVVGQGAFVMLRYPRSLKNWLVVSTIAVLSFVPWLLWALPQQMHYVNTFFNITIELAKNPNWRVPLSPLVLLRWIGVDVFSAVGLQPSMFQTRWLVPFAVGAIVLLRRSWNSSSSPTPSEFVLAWAQFGAALLGQILYAARLGHTTPLTVGYFVAAFPMIMLGTSLALWKLGSPGRAVVTLLAVWTLGNGLALAEKNEDFYAGSLDNLQTASAFARTTESSGEIVIVHRGSRLAQLFNLFYEGNARQLICPTNCPASTLQGSARVLVVSPVDAPVFVPPSGALQAPSRQWGRTVVDEYVVRPAVR